MMSNWGRGKKGNRPSVLSSVAPGLCHLRRHICKVNVEKSKAGEECAPQPYPKLRVFTTRPVT